MDTNKKELNINELEKVKGCGVITGFKNYVIPPRKKNMDGTESEQK